MGSEIGADTYRPLLPGGCATGMPPEGPPVLGPDTLQTHGLQEPDRSLRRRAPDPPGVFLPGGPEVAQNAAAGGLSCGLQSQAACSSGVSGNSFPSRSPLSRP